MDLLYFLKERLKFIEQLYDGAVAPFEETKRKIEEHEPPYVDNRDPEYVSEPAFLSEWQQADDSIMVIGHWALCIVHGASIIEGLSTGLHWANWFNLVEAKDIAQPACKEARQELVRALSTSIS